jgi:hypothetical protein
MYLNPVYSVIYLELVIASLWRKNSTNYPGFSWLCKITGRHLNYRPVFCPRYSKQIHKFFQNYLKLIIFELIMLIPGKFRPSWKKWCEIQSDGCLCRLPCLLNIIFWIHGSFSPAEKNSMEVKFFFRKGKNIARYRCFSVFAILEILASIPPDIFKKNYKLFQTFSKLFKFEEIILIHANLLW